MLRLCLEQDISNHWVTVGSSEDNLANDSMTSID